MHMESCPVRESIRETSDNSWVLGGRILLWRQPSPPSSGTFWSDGTGSFYTITDAPQPPPESWPLPATSHIKKVYDAGDVSADWMMGEAFFKVKILDERIPRATREHVTLNHLRNRSLSFTIPEVHHHAEFNGRYYIFMSKIHGETLGQAWARMGEEAKQDCASQVVSICKELAAWQADSISGVDGEHLSDLFLTPLGTQKNCSPGNFLRNCLELGMDCSTFMFYHCDLGPENIIVKATGEIVGIIDWETAGFVPKEWIRTKVCFSSGLDLPGDDIKERTDWKRRLQSQLETEGFPNVVDRWLAWWSNKK